MSRRTAFSTLELMVVCAIFALLIALLVIPAYDRYRRARQVDDAAVQLAADIAYLERYAENSDPFEGATIEVESKDPLRYTGYRGRPTSLDPQSRIRGTLFVRSYSEAALSAGPLAHDSPLMFAHNGSVQYVVGGRWADQHVPVDIVLRSVDDRARLSTVAVDPFTGAVSVSATRTP